MKNRILLKNKGCLFILLPKIYQLPGCYMMFARRIFFSRIWGTTALRAPVSYAYANSSRRYMCHRLLLRAR